MHTWLSVELRWANEDDVDGRRSGGDFGELSPRCLKALCASCRSLLFEYWAGTVIARIAANDKLVVMRRPAGES